MNKEHLKEYADLKVKEKEVKERLEELNPLIKQELLNQNIDKLPTTLGSFNIKKIKKWKYSATVSVMEEGLSALRTEEQADGTATFVEVPILEFRENKNE